MAMVQPEPGFDAVDHKLALALMVERMPSAWQTAECHTVDLA